MSVLTRGGERRIWEFHSSLRTDGVQSPIVRGVAHDITDRFRAEKALKVSAAALAAAEARHRAILKALPDWVFLLTRGRRVSRLSREGPRRSAGAS